jgi:hypothetical protein
VRGIQKDAIDIKMIDFTYRAGWIFFPPYLTALEAHHIRKQYCVYHIFVHEFMRISHVLIL